MPHFPASLPHVTGQPFPGHSSEMESFSRKQTWRNVRPATIVFQEYSRRGHASPSSRNKLTVHLYTPKIAKSC